MKIILSEAKNNFLTTLSFFSFIDFVTVSCLVIDICNHLVRMPPFPFPYSSINLAYFAADDIIMGISLH